MTDVQRWERAKVLYAAIRGRLIYPSNAEDEREAAVSQLVEALAEAERAGMEWSAKTIENLTMAAVAAEQRYRETHGKEELNGVRMSERVEFTLTSHGV